MPGTVADEDTDILVLLNEDLPDKVHCEFMDCKNNAEHQIVCPCMEGAEFICGEHRQYFTRHPETPLRFDITCKHAVLAMQCTLVSL